MPTYVYKCDSCGTQFEKLQSFKDEPLRSCPACAEPVRRVFQPVGIVFKGAGWYITDSRKSSSATVKDEAKAEKSDEPKTEAATAKTETASTGDTNAAKSEPVSKPDAAPSTASTSATSTV